MAGISIPIHRQVWVQDQCHMSLTITYFLKERLLALRTEEARATTFRLNSLSASSILYNRLIIRYRLIHVP